MSGRPRAPSVKTGALPSPLAGGVVGHWPGSGVSEHALQALGVTGGLGGQSAVSAVRPAGCRRRTQAGEAGLDLSQGHFGTELERRGQMRLPGI